MQLRRRTGSAIILVAFVLSALIGIGAIVVDLGYAHMVRSQLQNATDAGAHAGAQLLDGSPEGLDAARETTVRIAALNQADGGAVLLEHNWENDPDGDVVLGIWDGVDFEPSLDAEEVNAVRAQGRVPGLETWLSEVAFGRKELAVGARSTALLPEPELAGAMECYIPLAIPSCTFDLYPDDIELVDLVLNGDKVDNAAWSLVGGDPSSANSLVDQLHNCRADSAVALTDISQQNNGEVTAALRALGEEMMLSDTEWDEDLWGPLPTPMDRSYTDLRGEFGKTFEGPIIVFDGGPDCSTVDFGGQHPVDGFVWASVYDVQATGGAADKQVRMRLDTTYEHDWGSGGGGTLPDGISYQPPPMLVQ